MYVYIHTHTHTYHYLHVRVLCRVCWSMSLGFVRSLKSLNLATKIDKDREIFPICLIYMMYDMYVLLHTHTQPETVWKLEYTEYRWNHNYIIDKNKCSKVKSEILWYKNNVNILRRYDKFLNNFVIQTLQWVDSYWIRKKKLKMLIHIHILS